MNPVRSAALILSALLAIVDYAQAQCHWSGDSYKASWLYNPSSQSVQFTIEATPSSPNFWTGIGFGKQMSGGDFIIVTSANGVVNVSDRFGTGHVEPTKDVKNDVKDFSSQQTNGKLVATFSRAINTGDSQDVSLQEPPNSCQCFMFPTAGGATNGDNIEVHSKVPRRATVCNILQCTTPGGSGIVIDDGCAGNGVPPSNPAASSVTAGATGSSPQVGLNSGISQTSLGTSAGGVGSGSGGLQGTSGGDTNGASGSIVNGSSGTGVGSGQPQGGSGIATGAGGQSGFGAAGQSGLGAGAQSTTQNPINVAGGGIVAGSTIPAAGSGGACPQTQDNTECIPYIDKYWVQIFQTTNPPVAHPHRRPACLNLIKHQDGQVRRECCNYMKIKCGDFLTGEQSAAAVLPQSN